MDRPIAGDDLLPVVNGSPRLGLATNKRRVSVGSLGPCSTLEWPHAPCRLSYCRLLMADGSLIIHDNTISVSTCVYLMTQSRWPTDGES